MIHPDVTGCVLDGGRGTRMGGVNKGLVRYRGCSLFEYAVENLRQHVNSIIINSNTDNEQFLQRGYRVIGDGDYLYKGPLAGIYAAMDAVDTAFVAIAPCDQLALPQRVYAALIDQARRKGAAFAVDADDIHPTCAVLSINFAGSIRECLDSGRLRLGQWMKGHAAPVAFPDVSFANINTPTD